MRIDSAVRSDVQEYPISQKKWSKFRIKTVDC